MTIGYYRNNDYTENQQWSHCKKVMYPMKSYDAK